MTIKTTIKRALKPALLGAADIWLMQVLARLAPVGRAAPDAPRRFVVLPPASAGSLGDEAIVSAFVPALRQRMPDAAITLIVYSAAERAHYAHLGVDTVDMQGYLGFAPRLGALRRVTAAIRTGTDFVVLGADVLDGSYDVSHSVRRLYLAVLARRAGLRANVIGFSFAAKAKDGVKRFLRAHCRDLTFICRDPRSAERMSAVMEREIPSGADLAFLLPLPAAPSAPAAPAADAARAWRAEGRPVIVFNANSTGLRSTHPDIDVDACASAFAKAAGIVAARSGCGFLLLSHDNRPGVSDADFLGRIRALMPDGVATLLPDAPIRPADVKLLCAQADLTVTGRMHLGIASLGVGTPAMFYDYQGKVEGLLGLFDLPDMKFGAEDVLAPDRLAAMVLDRLARSEAMRAQIETRVADVRALSARNIDMVADGQVAP